MFKKINKRNKSINNKKIEQIKLSLNKIDKSNKIKNKVKNKTIFKQSKQ